MTADLASVFRSTIERAGLRLIVDCPPLPEPAYVDRDMWEKIVLNLVSNAFKHTFEGDISVALRQDADRIELSVRDTGVGIPAEYLAHLFERFYRVEGHRARSYEGSGIGLALVRELVRLHGGTVEVQSILDRGSCFTVSLPTGSAPLPPERISAARSLVSTSLGASVFVDEAIRWLPFATDARSLGFEAVATPSAGPSADSAPVTPGPPGHDKARVLIVDDNADMRDYLRGLLSPDYEVETVGDGAAARAEAEGALQARDEFLSVAAHELKTPITSLHLTAQLSQRRRRDRGLMDSDQLVTVFRRLDAQVMKLALLMDQLLDLSRLELGKLKLARVPADLSALLVGVVEDYRERSARHPVVVRTPSALVASVDPLRLEQVLVNLLDNAIKYSPSGGEIQLGLAARSAGWVTIWVRDHGLGIAPEHRAQIFDRFYQAHRDPGLAGLGLGLYVSRQIVELHGGRIRAEFPDDGGSRFVVELPIDAEAGD